MHDRVSVNALCFPGADLRGAAAAWREVGAHRVSFPSTLLGDDPAEAGALLREGGHRLESLVHLFFHERPLSRDEEAWAEERARLDRAVDAAAALGGRSVYMMTGGRGRLTWEEAAECFASAVEPCVARARELGIEVLIEPSPPLYADWTIAHSLRDALTLAELSGVGIDIDIYGCWVEAGLKRTIEAAVPRCHLVQVSDQVCGDRSVPSRAVPGDGDVPLVRILDWILSAGYEGAFDLELIGPRIDAEGHVNAVHRAAAVVGEMLASLGA